MTVDRALDLRSARRRLFTDALGIATSAGAFGVVFGLTARQAGYSLPEAIAMSAIVFGGASQFAAVGLVASGTPWAAIVLLTALLNARHLLYSASLAPWLTAVPRAQKAVMAHLLTDEAFALSLSHFRRLGRLDVAGYWIAAVGATFIPWNVATIVGFGGGQLIDDPARYGIDVVFPAAMGGLAVGLVSGRREILAVAVAIILSIGVAVAIDPRVAVVVGGLLGPVAGLALRPHDKAADGPDDDPAATTPDGLP